MREYWKTFFDGYGPATAASEDDLFLQAGHTIHRKPISQAHFGRIVAHLARSLRLSRTDNLVDLCCGNGLFTAELAAHVNHVTGVDFSSRNIATANAWKARENATYITGDATAPLAGIFAAGFRPNKFLMHHSLAYFEPEQFGMILENLLGCRESGPFLFLCSNIPNADLKGNFYDTPERRERHLQNETSSPGTNDGLGRWWSRGEITRICSQHGLAATIINQPDALSNYRMDALISAPTDSRV